MSSVLAMLMWFRKNLTSNGTSGSANKYTSLINTHVNKSYKTQQEQVTSKETKLSTIRFCSALDNSKQAVSYHLPWSACPYLTPFYLIVMDCWKYCKGYKFALSVARPRAKKLSASGGDQGLCPSTPLGAMPPDPRYRLALHTLAMCPPPRKLPMAPLVAPALHLRIGWLMSGIVCQIRLLMLLTLLTLLRLNLINSGRLMLLNFILKKNWPEPETDLSIIMK